MRGGKGAEQKSPTEVATPWGISITADSFISISFVENLCYNWFAVHPRYLTGEGVKGLNHLLTILESVVADVISHYICKWLDRFDKDRKPD